LGNPDRPVCAVVGGAKVSSKLDVLTNLVEKVDHLIIGGGMANTFLAAQDVDVGASLCEHDLADTARSILTKAAAQDCTIHLPTDLVVAKEFKAGAECRTIGLDEVASDEMILDVGPATVAGLSDMLKGCKTLIWNGPMGAFEITPFDMATVTLAKAAGALTEKGTLISVAGGGDTVAALNHAGVADQFSHISTAGGAFLEWMEGKDLPGVKVLEK
ncbi:MAG TPA: phosphoglycerate kinase, partial [Sphingomonadales bacterium]|nr:phosphoglycerate kinase [Sphingomonadales bacterium]